MRKTFDRDREQTTLQHVIADHELGVEASRRGHYEEWARLVEPHFGRKYDEDGIRKRVEELMAQQYSIHFHCWDADGFKELLSHMRNALSFSFEVRAFIEREDEFIAILTKQPQC